MNEIELLEDYLVNFYGYGNPNAKYLFIGFEEGDTLNGEEFKIRLENWKDEGDSHFMDIQDSHRYLFGQKFYISVNNEPVKNQATITRAVKMYLIINGDFNKSFAIDSPAEFHQHSLCYQGTSFARKEESETALIEFYPLPSRRVNSNWEYGKRFPKIEWLANREKYMNYINKHRIENIFKLIKDKAPKLVVMFVNISGTNAESLVQNMYEKTFKSILKNKKIGNQNIWLGNTNNTVFILMKHLTPQAGIKNNDLYSISEYVNKLLEE